jgi:hypothetical protein
MLAALNNACWEKIPSKSNNLLSFQHRTQVAQKMVTKSQIMHDSCHMINYSLCHRLIIPHMKNAAILFDQQSGMFDPLSLSEKLAMSRH